MKKTHYTCLALFLASIAPMFGDETGDWHVLYQENHETAGLGARLWGGIGNSGPSGGSFAGVTGQTSSRFDGGWQSYELRLGTGGSLRENYFWLLHRLDDAPAFDALRFRCDFMGDATMSDVNIAFELFGGEGRGLGNSLLSVSVRGGVLHVDKQRISEFAPHVWYRLELDVRCDDEAGQMTGTATIREPDRTEPVVVELALPFNPAAVPLRNLKLAKGRQRDDPTLETRFYLDNVWLAVRAVSNE